MHLSHVLRWRLAALLFAAIPVAGHAQDAAPESLDTIPLAPAAPEPAPADDSVTELDSIEITGSRIRRTDFETSQPILAISRQDIERSGLTNIGDLLQDLPGSGSAINTQFNNGGTGATEIDLRNLGSNRVLVLVNGRRWVNGLRSLSTSSVDLNTIPLAIIERVEVLKDGASAIYGSDAIAGVVNIITRKNYEGTQFASQFGQYQQGDGRTQEHNVSYGRTFSDLIPGTTTVFGNLSYSSQGAVFARDREISRLPRPNTGLTRASGFLPEGHFIFVADPVNAAFLGTEKCPGLAGGIVQGALDDPGAAVGDPFTPGSLPAIPVTLPDELQTGIPGAQLCNLRHIPGAGNNPGTDYAPFVAPNDNFNFSDISYLATPLQTYNAFTTLNHQFENGIGLSLEGLYSLRKSTQRLAGQPICIGDICPIIGGQIPGQPISYNQASYAPADHPFNVFAQDIGRTNPDDPAGLMGVGAILRRTSDAGDRNQIQETPTAFGRFTATGLFDLPFEWRSLTPFAWELGYSHGQTQQEEILEGQIDMRNLMLGLGPTENCAAARAAGEGCVPVDFFGGVGALTPEMLEYITFTAFNNTEQTQKNVYGSMATSLTGLLPAGPLGIALGFELRKDEYDFLPDIHAIEGTTSGLPQKPTSGTIEAKEGFLELAIPVLANLPFAQELEVSLAGRYSEYESFGSSRNGKVGLRWKPYEDLLIRGSYANSFRAPDVGNLFLGQASSYPALVDPCVPGDTSPRQPGNNTDINCSADGVDDTVTQDFLQILSPFGGNESLQPEVSHSLTYGFVFSPQQLEGLELSVDYFNISVKNYITAPGGQYILDQCYSSNPDNRSLCQFIGRNPANNQLQSVLNLFNNFPRIETSGYDFGLGYTLPNEDLGVFKFSVDASYLASFKRFQTGLSGQTEEESLAGKYEDSTTAYPRWKINPSLQWKSGALQAALNGYIVWHVNEPCFDGVPPSLPELGVCSDPNHVDETGTPDPRNEIPTAMRLDGQFGFSLERQKMDFLIGMQNLLDEDPPISYSTLPAIGYNPSDYWIPGRLPYLRVKKSF